MALSKKKIREILSAAGVEADNMAEAVDRITDGHVASIEALKEERDSYKADAEKLEDVQKELDELKKTVSDDDGYKQKYEDLKKEYTEYKTTQTKAQEKATKDKAYREMLKEIGILDKRIDSVMRVTDLETVKVDADGKLVDADALKKTAADEWSDFIGKEDTKGASVSTPPANDPKPAREKSRAAQLEQKYHGDIYGESPKED